MRTLIAVDLKAHAGKGSSVLIAQVPVPNFSELPKVIVWGTRTFLFETSGRLVPPGEAKPGVPVPTYLEVPGYWVPGED